LDGHLVTIPNKTVGNAAITNISKRPHIRTIMTIGITYDTPGHRVQEAKALLEEIYRSHPKTKDLIVGFDKFAEFYLNLNIIHWWNGTDFKEYFAGMHELNVKVKERLDAARISFAFPTQTLYLRQDSEWRVSGSMGVPPSATNAAAPPSV
jgi:MscS family membrane protein